MDISFHSSKNVDSWKRESVVRKAAGLSLTAFHPTLSTEVKFSLQPYLARRVLAIADSFTFRARGIKRLIECRERET
jgi:hypothetical protein